MHNFLRVGDIGDALLILTVGIVQPPYQKQKINSASFFLSLVRLAALRGMLSVDSNSGSAFKRRFELKKISENLRYLRETNISPRTTMRSFLTSRAYWPQLPSLFIRPFFLKKKDQKFKPALRRMLKHRKNVALHAQFFARWRYRGCPADTNCRDCATSLPKAKNHSST